MTEWTVVGVLIALVGFISAVVAPIVKLNTTIVKLTQIVDSLAGDVSELTKRNSDTHSRIFEQLGDHETRITVLEHDIKK